MHNTPQLRGYDRHAIRSKPAPRSEVLLGRSRARRSRSSTVSPAATVKRYQHAILVPQPRRIYRRSAMDDVVVDAVFRGMASAHRSSHRGTGHWFRSRRTAAWRLAGRILTGNKLPPAEQFFFRDRANNIASVAGGRTDRPVARCQSPMTSGCGTTVSAEREARLSQVRRYVR